MVGILHLLVVLAALTLGTPSQAAPLLLDDHGSDAVRGTEKLLLAGVLDHEARLQYVERRVTNLAALPARIQSHCNRALSGRGSLDTRVTDLEEYYNELRNCLFELRQFTTDMNFTFTDMLYHVEKDVSHVLEMLERIKNEEGTTQQPETPADTAGSVHNFPFGVETQAKAKGASNARSYAHSLNTYISENKQDWFS